MQGVRYHEECGVLLRTPQRRMIHTTQQTGVFNRLPGIPGALFLELFMIVTCAAIIVGLVLLVWSSDLFVDGAAGLAAHFGVSPFIIGMVIVGFGTSLPEMLISILSAIQGNPGIALGNAYGSNIANIGLILGITALVCPVAVPVSNIQKRAAPALCRYPACRAVRRQRPNHPHGSTEYAGAFYGHDALDDQKGCQGP